MINTKQYIHILGCFPKFRNRKKYNLQFAVRLAYLDYSNKFKWATNDKLLQVWNGVGASGKWYNRFIPKTVWGLNIELCSLPHDYDYLIGGGVAKKQKADKRFLKNLLKWCKLHTKNKLLLRLREIACYKYYIAVRAGGHSAFNWR